MNILDVYKRQSLRSANVETMYRLVDGQLEALEFIIRKENNYRSHDN